MNIDFIRCPLHKYTFRVKKIRFWVEAECEGRTLNLFAGPTKLDVDEVRNDLDESMLAETHMDALEFCRIHEGELFDTILLDPPYALRKSMEMYNGKIMSPFNQLKDAIVPILKPGGKVITFGYHSVVLGKVRGFDLEKICIFSHGGAIHDTIASVERKK